MFWQYSSKTFVVILDSLLANVLLLFILISHFAECKQTLSNTVLYHEPVEYTHSPFGNYKQNTQSLLETNNNNIHLEFNAHGRVFRLELQREHSLFTRDLIFNENEHFHPSNVYKGRLLDEPLSYVHGYIHDDIFEGFIRCNDGCEYIIESSKQYTDGDAKENSARSVIYRTKDYIKVESYNIDSLKVAEFDKDDTLFENETKIAKLPARAKKRQKRSLSDDKSRACTIELLADPTFVEYAGDKNRAMYLMVQHLKSARDIFEAVDFNGDGIPDKYSFVIKKISIIDTTPCKTYSSLNICKYMNKNIAESGEFLDISSVQVNSDYCLSYVFCHRSFNLGILGVAWQGFPATKPGGICSRVTNEGTPRILNTGVVTNVIGGKVVSNVVTGKVFAHELAHSFGSSHDSRVNASCVPASDEGNYLMYPTVQFGSGRNTFLLSPCSKAEINTNIQAKLKQGGCFIEKEPVCGNKEVEAGEECDCGYENEASCREDPCCQGATTLDGGGNGCVFTAKAKVVAQEKRCSPSQGFCCDGNTCSLYANNTKVCSEASECISKKTMCIDSSYTCPKATPVPERSVCDNGSRTCVKGDCVGSVCLLINKRDCQCSNQTELCHVCCKDRGSTSPCLRYTPRTIQKPTGSLCNRDKGRCEASKCILYDESKILMTLFNWFKQKTILVFNWGKENWWVCVLTAVVLLVIIVMATSYYIKHKRSSTSRHVTSRQRDGEDELPLNEPV